MSKPRATKSDEPKRGVGAPRRYDRAAVAEKVCAELKRGRSLESICAAEDMPHVGTFLEWVERDSPAGIAQDYAHARKIGYALLAEEIVALADKTHEWVMTQELDPDGQPMFEDDGRPRLRKVLMPLSADVIAHKRVQIDTRKWMLSKMLPKVYGDRLTTEHTGAEGGPVQVELSVFDQILNNLELKRQAEDGGRD
jgi:hypothetical protein